MIYLELLLGFLRVGCFSFGGAYAAIPLIRDVVLSYGWLNEEMVADMIAVSESTPGPIMVNMATYVGSTQAGLPGAAVATLAVVLPSFIVILLVTALLTTALKNPWVQAVLRGMKPCIAGVILGTGACMILKNGGLFPGLRPALPALGLTAGLAALYFGAGRLLKKGVSPIALILVSALAGIVFFGG